MNKGASRLIAVALLQSVIVYALFGALLFGAAGTLAWPAAWGFLLGMVALSVGGTFWLARIDPGLLRERLKSPLQKEQGAADKAFIGALMVAMLAWLVVMGLDARFAWSAVPSWVQAAGWLMLLAAVWLGMAVMRENSFAAPVVKIQHEREQHVVSSGPYRFVRHPMYSGGLLFFFAVPLLLGAWWGLAGAALLAALFCVRTFIEEAALLRGLPGYADYRSRVRYRLIPRVW